MSDLQIGLLAIGAVVIAAVAGFNWWQLRSMKRRASAAFDIAHEDVLLSGKRSASATPGAAGRHEPSLEQQPVADGGPVPTAEGRTPRPDGWLYRPEFDHPPLPVAPRHDEPVAAAPRQDDPPRAAPRRQEEDHAAVRLDGTIDYVVVLHPDDPISGPDLDPLLRATSHMGKPVTWVGLCERTGWEPVRTTSDRAYLEIQAGMQLVTRNGPVTEAQLQKFTLLLQDFGAANRVVVDCPEHESALVTAGGLDAFCADVDVMLGFNVIAEDHAPFAGTKLRSLCEAQGLVLEPDGVFHQYDDHGQGLYTLVNMSGEEFSLRTLATSSVPGVTLLFDVPRVPDGLVVYDHAVAFAERLADVLGGRLVDDNRRPLTKASIDSIRQQVQGLYAKMTIRRIIPGSKLALRLFS